MYKHVDTLMQKEMSRQEFLTTLGFGLMSLFGFSSIIKMMNGMATGNHKIAENGYGSSAYGGNAKATS
jgi:hypothetical protein